MSSFDTENMSRQKDFIIPKTYLLPTGGPLYWRDEVSGVLTTAVLAYLNDTASDASLKLLADYLEYYIHAPCWDIPGNAFADELAELRRSSKTMQTAEEIDDWISRAMDIGIDPL